MELGNSLRALKSVVTLLFLLLLLLLFCCSPVLPDEENGSLTDCPQNKTPVYVLVLLSFQIYEPMCAFTEQPSLDDGPQILPAVELAVEQINERDDLLRDYCVRILVDNSGCDVESQTLRSLFSSIVHMEGIAGVVGPTCTASTITVSYQTSKPLLSLVNFHIASSQELENRVHYPNAFGTVAPVDAYVNALRELSLHANWTKVGVFYEESRPFFSSMYSKLIREFDKWNISINYSNPIREQFLPQPNVDSDIRIFMILSGTRLTRMAACLLFNSKKIYPLFQFVIIEAFCNDLATETAFDYHGKHYNCSTENMREALDVSILLHYRLTPMDKDMRATNTSNLTYWEYEQLYREKARMANVSTTEWANPVYDGLWSLALALNETDRTLPNQNLNISNLSEYRRGNRNLTEVIRKNVQNLDFEGASGRVKYNPNSGYNSRAVDISQMADGESYLEGYYKPGKLQIRNSCSLLDASFTEIRAGVDILPVAFFTAVTLTLLSIILLVHCLICAYRNKKSVKASSVRIGHLAFIACYMMGAGGLSIIWAELPVDRQTYNAVCHFQRYTINISVTLILNTISVKAYRLYRIYSHYNNPGVMLSDRHLIIIAITFCVPILIACLLQSAFHRDQILETNRTMLLDKPPYAIHEITMSCDTHPAWSVFFLIHNLLFMLTALVLSIAARRVNKNLFRPRNYAMFVYTMLLQYILVASMYYAMLILNVGALIKYIVLCCSINVTLFFCIVLLSFPLLPMLTQTLKRKDF